MSKSKGNYEVEMIVIGKGTNLHRTFRSEKLEGNKKIDKVRYAIDLDTIHLKSRNLLQRLKDRFRGVSHRFLIVYKEGGKAALIPEKSEVDEKGKPIVRITSELLDIVERSQILRSAFSELFHKYFGSKKILFVVILTVFGFLVVMQLTGKIDLLGGWSL